MRQDLQSGESHRNVLSKSNPVIEAASEAGTVATRQVTPFPAAAESRPNGFAKTVTEGALAVATDPEASQSVPDSDSLRQAVVMALAAVNHATASQLLGTGIWTLDGSSLRIEVPGMGKKMLALAVNAAAEKIIRQELQRLGAPSRFMVVSGEGKGVSTASVEAPTAGSVQEAALANPMVMRAKEIFNAEVRSVVDLRSK